MLQCNMNASKRPIDLENDLEDILGSLQFARRSEDLGRLALLTYWEVRRWARVARQDLLAEHAAKVITEHPHPTRVEFLEIVDGVIEELKSIRSSLH
jgi:hypothetical protein